MNKSLLYRGLLILAVTVLVVVAFWPPEKKIKLGLDLRGGIHLVLRVKVDDALRAERDKVAERLSQESQSSGGPALPMQPLSASAFAVDVPAGARQKILDVARAEFGEWQPEATGNRVVFRLKEDERRRLSDLAVNQALKTIDNRINAFGVAEPLIQRQGMTGDRILVQLPGV
ncbi:MAG TPA: hypothetical protein VN923_12350, partial [Thermoanaerobaculia bacterium]|nr:hypothetical protein [Thermoanaerobaculia bacterium]